MIASMSAPDSDANMMTQDSPRKAFAVERMHEGEDDTDIVEVNAEFVEVEVLVKESSQVRREELVQDVKLFLRSGAEAPTGSEFLSLLRISEFFSVYIADFWQTF